MLVRSHLFSEMRGSIAGVTYSRNRGGLYGRARATPVNPGTPYQEQMRLIIQGLMTRWKSVLTGSEIGGWRSIAVSYPATNSLGESIQISGPNMYVIGNASRIQAGLPRVDDPDANFAVFDFTAPAFSASEATQEVSVAFTNTDFWANQDGGALLLYVSRPQSASIEYFKGPYRYAGKILGDSVTPPTSPATIAAPFPFIEGQRLFCRVVAIEAGGLATPPFRGQCDAAA